MSNRISVLSQNASSDNKRKSTSVEEEKLARELAHLLGRPPRRSGHRNKDRILFDDEEEIHVKKKKSHQKARSKTTPPPLPTGAKVEKHQSDAIKEPTTIERGKGNVWHPKRKHTRLKQAASWLLSLFIGGLIVTVVALILLGIPKNFDIHSMLSANAAALQTQTNLEHSDPN